MFPEIIISVLVAAFVLEFFDSAAGMGFGTLTPLLILLGHELSDVIPAVLFCSSLLSLSAGILHHGYKNVDLLEKKTFKIVMMLLGFGLAGILLGVFGAVVVPDYLLEMYIGVLVMTIGIIIMVNFKERKKFSWKRLIFFGSIASFNKGMTGGGFGPVLSGGQIMSGVKSKHAVGVTSITEGILSMAGVIGFIFIGEQPLNWSLIISLLIGGFVSLPIAIYTVKKLHPKHMRLMIGAISILLGVAVIFKQVWV